MDLPLSRQAVPVLLVLDEAGSTNDELSNRAASDAASWPDRSVIVTDNQTRGRGRLGRTWSAPSGRSLAVSILLRPRIPSGAGLPVESLGWIPLSAGVAMTHAVRRAIERAAALDAGTSDAGTPDAYTNSVSSRDTSSRDTTVALKWPNDVLVARLKVSGILSELVSVGVGHEQAIVVGAGVNTALGAGERPTATSTSLALLTGSAPDVDALLADYLSEFSRLYGGLLKTGGDAQASGLSASVTESCATLGTRVHVQLPGDRSFVGRAEGLDATGRLLVRDEENATIRSVAAGDIVHLR